MIRVLVNGAKGRMGQEVVRAVQADAALQLAGEADMSDDLLAAIKAAEADVVVDFTVASSGFRNAELILQSGARPVIGTSGFKQDDVEKLQKLAAQKQLGGVIAPNFAIGAVLLMKFSREAARYMPDVEIIELHHDQKADSPSGTAIRTAELIALERDKGKRGERVSEHTIIPGARGAELEQIRIHSVRLPGFVAQQQVIFGSKGQTLTLKHDSNHRESFMPGVCHACKAVMTQKELFYGLEHLL